MEEKKSKQKACRKVREGVWYLEEEAVWLLEATAALRRTQGEEIPPTSLLNATSVLPTKHCISTSAQIQREPCLCVTDSCVKLVSQSVYTRA